MVSACRRWGTQRANPRALQRNVFVRPCSGEPALSGPPLKPLMHPAQPPVRAGDQAPRGSGTQGTNPGPLWHSAVVRLRLGDPAPSGKRESME